MGENFILSKVQKWTIGITIATVIIQSITLYLQLTH